MKWVLSKGLVHFNVDVEPSVLPIPRRTEVRVLRCFAVEQDGVLKLDPEYIHQAIAAVLLATAMLASEGELVEIAEQFRQQLDALANSLPPSFQQLRPASFYDSTGDGSDPEWLASLPLVRTLSGVREDLRLPDVRQRVEDGFRRLRDATVTRIARSLGLETRQPASIPRQDLLPTPYGFSVFIPRELQDLLKSTLSGRRRRSWLERACWPRAPQFPFGTSETFGNRAP